MLPNVSLVYELVRMSKSPESVITITYLPTESVPHQLLWQRELTNV